MKNLSAILVRTAVLFFLLTGFPSRSRPRLLRLRRCAR